MSMCFHTRATTQPVGMAPSKYAPSNTARSSPFIAISSLRSAIIHLAPGGCKGRGGCPDRLRARSRLGRGEHIRLEQQITVMITDCVQHAAGVARLDQRLILRVLAEEEKGQA